MSRETGKLYTCDACGKTEFVKFYTYQSLVTGSMDNSFADTQENWTFVPGLGDLCESCYHKYQKMLENFKESFHE